MPLLEDYQNLLEQEERRKTLFGNALSSLDNINPPEQDEMADPFSAFLEPIPTTPAQTQLSTPPPQGLLDKYLLINYLLNH